jgi:hypothetical protein
VAPAKTQASGVKKVKSIHWHNFYNTSQALPRCAQGSPGEKKTCWPVPEYPATLNTTQLGNLGLTSDEEDDIVAFLKTLTDGFVTSPQTFNRAASPKNRPQQ